MVILLKVTDQSHTEGFVPKATFHNLPELKQTRIVDAALDEFAAVPFEAASLNRIVRGAGIAKGSFYQYFENMVDLYEHVVVIVGAQRKAAMVRTSLTECHDSFFGQFRHACTMSLRFGLTEPKSLAASRHLWGPIGPDSALKPLFDKWQGWVRSGLEETLAAAVQSGAVRADVDLSATATLLQLVLTHGLQSMMRQKLGFNLHDVILDQSLADTVDNAALEDVVDALLDVIFRGIRANPEAGGFEPDLLFNSGRPL